MKQLIFELNEHSAKYNIQKIDYGYSYGILCTCKIPHDSIGNNLCLLTFGTQILQSAVLINVRIMESCHGV